MVVVAIGNYPIDNRAVYHVRKFTCNTVYLYVILIDYEIQTILEKIPETHSRSEYDTRQGIIIHRFPYRGNAIEDIHKKQA